MSRKHLVLRRAFVPALCLSSLSALAADQTITVTATRVPQRVSEALSEVTVLDRTAIERSEGRSLVELLSQQAGLQFSNNGGLGKTSGLFMRGLEARHTLLLVDGVRIFSATVGTPSLDNLPLEAIDRIEIVRGPLSSLYGSGAMGGVIQVFTRKAAPGLSANAKLAAGSNEFGQAAGGVGFGTPLFDVAAQVQHTNTQGFSATNATVPFGSYNEDRDGFRQTGGSLRLGVNLPADWRLEALALQSKGRVGLDDGPGASARAELQNNFSALSARGKVLPAWDMRFSASNAVDRYDTLSSASAFASLGAIQSRQQQLGWENTVFTPIGTVLALVERTTEKVSRPGQPFDVSERSIDGLAAGLNGNAGAHAWQASLRRDRNSQFGGKTSGALGYGFTLAPGWRVGGSYGTSFVAPSFNQLYYPGFSNPLLLPEEGKHAELNLRWTAGEHSLYLAAYQHRYRGFITSGPAPVNLPKAQIEGYTLSYEGRWRALAFNASLDHTDPRNDTVGNANFDKLLPRRAQNALRLGADWTGGPWSAGATMNAFSHRFDNAANTQRLGGYGTLDVRGEWALTRELKLGLKLNNLGDKTYETALGYNQPGREGFVTLRYSLR